MHESNLEEDNKKTCIKMFNRSGAAAAAAVLRSVRLSSHSHSIRASCTSALQFWGSVGLTDIIEM